MKKIVIIFLFLILYGLAHKTIRGYNSLNLKEYFIYAVGRVSLKQLICDKLTGNPAWVV